MNKALFFLIAFLFAFIPLYPKFPLINIRGTFVAVRLEDFLVAILIVFWLIYLLSSNNIRNFIKDNLNKSILVFFFTGLVSVFSAIFLTHTVSSNLSILHFLRRIEYLLLLPAVATFVTTKKRLVTILIVSAITVVLVNGYAFGQQYLDWPVISTTNSEFSKGLILRLTPGARVNSTFAGHYDLAVFLAMILVLSSSLFFAFKKQIKPLIFLIVIPSMLVLIMTAARISFLAAFVGIIFALIFSNKKKYLLFIFICSALILLYPSQLRDRFISTITVNIFNLGQRYQGKTLDQQLRSRLNIPTLAYKTSSTSASISSFLESSSSTTASDITPGEPIDTTDLGVYRSFQIRFNIEWPRALNAFYKNPLLGTGYSSLDIATDNDFLRSLGEVGILGTLAFILILIETFKEIFRGIKSDDKLIKYLSAGTFSLIITILINGVFIDVFEASKVAFIFWMILGVNIGILKGDK